jgi:hypothetical protein
MRRLRRSSARVAARKRMRQRRNRKFRPIGDQDRDSADIACVTKRAGSEDKTRRFAELTEPDLDQNQNIACELTKSAQK